MFIVVIKRMVGNQKFQEIQRNFKYYDELLGLVLKIEDKALQKDIVSAINSIPRCLRCMPKETNTKSTQTGELEDRLDLKYSDNRGKRKRRRSKKGPEVIPTKKILFEEIHQPSTSSSAISTPPPQPIESPPILDAIAIIEDLLGLPFADEILKNNDTDTFSEQDDIKNIEKTMVREFISCYKQEDGFYPIQRAIMNDDFKLFQRQLYVLNLRKIDLNGIFTEDHLNLLELAIRSKPKFALEYFNNLTKSGMKLNTIDEVNQSSILDVIVSLTDNEKYFSYFVKQLHPDFLTNLNSDGCGILHMCVKKNQFKMVEILLNHIDTLCGLKPLVFEEPMENEEVVENLYKEAFLSISERKKTHPIKESILNLKETTSERTPLLMALSSQYLHIAYMLLNHLADPLIKDSAGNDGLAFLTSSNKEKNKHLEDVIVNVSTILKQYRESL